MGALASALRNPRAVRACQIVIGVIFVIAALAKLSDLEALSTQVHNFRLVPLWGENLVAMMLPWVELTAALFLILGFRARAGAFVLAALLAAFTVGVGIAVARGLDFECGCFGTGDHTRVGAVKIAENLAMLAVAIEALQRPR